jgi:type IV pilus assembly protein PilB
MILNDDQLHALVVRTGLIDEAGIARVMEYGKNTNISLYDALVERNVIGDENLGTLIADSLKIPFITLSKISIPPALFHIVPERLARREKIIAFGRDARGIHVAMADPRRAQIIAMLTRKTNAKIFPYFATERDIANSLQLYKRDLQKAFDELMGVVDGKTTIKVENSPLTQIVDMIISYAYQERASDIHIEVNETNSLVRFRLDGVLHDMLLAPKAMHDRIVTRIKVLSRLRTDEHQAAQDGKMRVPMDEETLDIRVSIVDGEKVVLRLLSSRSRLFSLQDLGMTEADLKKVERAFTKSFGMVLSTGPTGSGKTTSIYAILKIINSREKNITTIEDPAEYRIKGLNQIQVNPKTNLTFAAGLRSILRQDPNVIFVGEIRDNETAGIAVNAALTGHLVLSTLHTNDAATTLPRLTDMKVEPFLVASTVSVILGQRLIRRICESCKTTVSVTPKSLEGKLSKDLIDKYFGKKEETHIYKGAGCRVCHGSGFKGRVGLFEVLEVTKEIRRLITEKKDADMIREQARREGMTTMMDDGLVKVLEGATSLEEVLRVTKVET